MSTIRNIKVIEQLLRKYPQIYKFCKRTFCTFYSDELFDYKGLVDNFAIEPNVLYFRHYGEKNAYTPIYFITYGVYNHETCGFFGMFNTTLKQLAFADFYKLEPTVCWQNCIYSENGSDNVFEYYFEPVSKITTDEVLESAYVCPALFGDSRIITRKEENRDRIGTEQIERLAEIYDKYIKFNELTRESLKNDIEMMFGQKKGKNLGVQARGTDAMLELYGHPLYVSIEEYITHVEKIYNTSEYESIFLATEDEKIRTAFEAKFGTKLLFYKDVIRSQKSAIDIANERRDIRGIHRKMGYEVLRDAVALSCCDALVGGPYNVPIAAQIIKIAKKERFSQVDIIDHGLNTKKNFYVKDIIQK